MSELRLHTNKALDTETSKYYHAMLYLRNDYGPFLTASLEAMMQVFYIELDGFIGAYWEQKQGCVQKRKNEVGSLATYLYDGKRTKRKKEAQDVFAALLQQNSTDLEMVNQLRHKLAHFKKLNERNRALAPGDIKIREILNKLVDTLYLLGFQRWNKPHYIQLDNDASSSTQKVVDMLVSDNNKASQMRQTYTKARSKWFGTATTNSPED
jgi:hypothetical protein